MGRAARKWQLRRCINRWSAAMPQPNDLSRSLVTLDQNSTIISVVELSQSSWLVAGMLPGIERQPRKKLEPSPERLLALLHRWRDEAVRAGHTITRIALAFEAGRDGFWLARWLAARGVEAQQRSLARWRTRSAPPFGWRWCSPPSACPRIPGRRSPPSSSPAPISLLTPACAGAGSPTTRTRSGTRVR